MSIRIATIEDTDLVLQFCKNFYSTLRQKDLVSEDRVKQIIQVYLTSPKEEKICLLHGEKGMLAGFVQPYVLGDEPIATETAWWVEPEARKQNVGRELVEAFEFWAKKLNCKYCVLSCYADNDVGKFYENCGYQLHEKAYMKEI